MSEASEAPEQTVAESIISKLVGSKEDNETYRTHIRSLIESNFFYAVLTADGCSLSLTANGKDADAWRAFALAWHKEILSKRVSGDEEDGGAYKSKNGDQTPGYG